MGTGILCKMRKYFKKIKASFCHNKKWKTYCNSVRDGDVGVGRGE